MHPAPLHRERARGLTQIVVALVAIYLALYVWPTPYREYRFDNRILRVNRVTGTQQLLTPAGWE